MGTLRTLVRRAYDICSTNEHLQNELSHIKKVFHEQTNTHFGQLMKSLLISKLNKATNNKMQEQHQQQ